jgi:phosphate uptake regulator
MIQFDNHAFKGLDEALHGLFSDLQAMGEELQQILALLPAQLERKDPNGVVQAKAIDRHVNETELRVYAAVEDIIAKYTVMGEEKRFVLLAVKLASTLEMAADKAKNCVKRLGKLHGNLDNDVRSELARAIEAVRRMVPLAIAQIIDFNSTALVALLEDGAKIQKSYRAVVVALHRHHASAEDETHIMLAAKNLDQMGDMLIEIMKVSYFIHHNSKYEKRQLTS